MPSYRRAYLRTGIEGFRGSRTLHRRLGWLAAAIATAMVLLVAGAAVEEMRRVPPSPPPPIALALNTFDMVLFTILVSSAIDLRKLSEWHRRLLLSATLVLLGAPILRLLIFLKGDVTHGLLILDVLLVDMFFSCLLCLRSQNPPSDSPSLRLCARAACGRSSHHVQRHGMASMGEPRKCHSAFCFLEDAMSSLRARGSSGCLDCRRPTQARHGHPRRVL